jgi:hypothetical protein
MSLNFLQTRYIPSRLHRRHPYAVHLCPGRVSSREVPPHPQYEIPETRLICKELTLSDVDVTFSVSTYVQDDRQRLLIKNAIIN